MKGFFPFAKVMMQETEFTFVNYIFKGVAGLLGALVEVVALPTVQE